MVKTIKRKITIVKTIDYSYLEGIKNKLMDFLQWSSVTHDQLTGPGGAAVTRTALSLCLCGDYPAVHCSFIEEIKS